MIDFARLSKRLTVSCIATLISLLAVLLVIYMVLHTKHKHDYVTSAMQFGSSKTPNFSLPTVSQPQIIVNEKAFKNKVTLISVWSSRCRNYKKEHKVLLDIAKRLRGKRINFVGLNSFDSQEHAMEWLTVHGDPYDFSLFDQQGTLTADLGTTNVPDFLIIDSYGYIQYRYSGTITREVWENNIRPILDMIYLGTS